MTPDNKSDLSKKDNYSIIITSENTIGKRIIFSQGNYFLLALGSKNTKIQIESSKGLSEFTGAVLASAEESFAVRCQTDRFISILINGDTFKTLCSFLYTDIFRKTPCAAAALSAEENNRLIDSIEKILFHKTSQSFEMDKKRAVFDIISKYFCGVTPSMSQNTEDIPAWLEKLYEQMKIPSNFTKGVSRMTELSKKSPEHLSRSMKKYYKVTPTQFINDLRMKNVARLLIETDESVMDICFENGYQNISWFNTLFKETYSSSPTEYRQMHRNK